MAMEITVIRMTALPQKFHTYHLLPFFLQLLISITNPATQTIITHNNQHKHILELWIYTNHDLFAPILTTIHSCSLTSLFSQP